MIGGAKTERKIRIKEEEFDIDKIQSLVKTKIDDYNFAIVCWTLIEERIGVVLISSLYASFSEYDVFVVYASQSELDFFRLLYQENTRVPYYKGKWDYTQQTFIDNRLQVFLHENYKYSPYKKNLNVIDTDLIKNIELKNVTDQIERINDVDFLKPESKYPFNQNAVRCGTTKLKKEEGETDEDVYNRLIQHLSDFSLLLKSTFDFDEPIHCYKFKKDIVDNDANKLTVNFYIDVYSTILTNKTNADEKYILYFVVYDLCSFNLAELYDDSEHEDEEFEYKVNHLYANSYKENKVCRYRNKFAPLSIVPFSRKINKFGLSDKIIFAGNYTCKVLDYNSQCTPYENTTYLLPDTGYSYIGNRYNNLFPLKEIQELYPNVVGQHAPPKLSDDEMDFYKSFYKNPLPPPMLQRINTSVYEGFQPGPPMLSRNTHQMLGVVEEEGDMDDMDVVIDRN